VLRNASCRGGVGVSRQEKLGKDMSREEEAEVSEGEKRNWRASAPEGTLEIKGPRAAQKNSGGKNYRARVKVNALTNHWRREEGEKKQTDKQNLPSKEEREGSASTEEKK